MFITVDQVSSEFGSFGGVAWGKLATESELPRNGQWFYRCPVERLIADVEETMKS